MFARNKIINAFTGAYKRFFNSSPTTLIETPAEAIQNLPKRYQAFFFQEPKPDTLNMEESTTSIYRLMSVKELNAIKNVGVFGNDPTKLSYYSYNKRLHLHLPEHVQENNSKLILSFAKDPMSAANYAGIGIFPNFYALVKTNIPPVFTIPSVHAKLDQAVFDEYHQIYSAQELNYAYQNGTKYVPPINSSILSHTQQEIDMILNTPKGECDFRSHPDEMIQEIHFLWGGFRNFMFVKNPQPLFFHNITKRDWAIEVLCPVNEANYVNMLAKSRNEKLIPSRSRPLTVEDAVMIYPHFTQIFPAQVNFHKHVHILKYVPEELAIGSSEVVHFLIKEHSLFRTQHECIIDGRHDYKQYTRQFTKS